MRIVVLGDVHGHRQRLVTALGLVSGHPCDIALLVGDLGTDPPWEAPARTDHRADHDNSVRQVLEVCRQALGCPLVFVPGNHDLPDPPAGLAALNADGRVVECRGLRVAGFGGAGPEPFGFAYEWSEAEARAALGRSLDLPAGGVDIFLSHAPPAGSRLDRTHRGRHVGSAAVREWIGRLRPKLFACGHIHEAWGLECIDRVPCLNAGALGEPHGQCIVWIVEWDATGPGRIHSFHSDDRGGGLECRPW